MGNYITITNRPDLIKELKEVFEKHFKINKNQFKNDFGELHEFEDIFDIYDKNQSEFQFKTGVMDKNFYSKEFMQDVENVVNKEFRFTDWHDERKDHYGTWEECKKAFDEAIKEEPEGRFSIYDSHEDMGALFNENCPEYD